MFSLPSMIEILLWKQRFNAHQEPTISRFIVLSTSKYYQVIGRHSNDDLALINLEVTQLTKEIKSNDDAVTS